MRKQNWFLAVAMVAVLLGGSSQARAGIVNGDFETGDMTGWSVSPAGLAYAQSSVGKLSEAGTWSAYSGNFFGYLQTGAGAGVYTLVSQSFTVGAGDKLQLAVFFDAGDYMPFNDNAYVKVINTTTLASTTIYYNDVAGVGDYGSSPWQLVNHTFTAGGSYKLELGVTNIGDNSVVSALGADVVSLTSAVPEPASMTMLGLGIAGIAGYSWRKRKQNAAKKTVA